ncbi:MAG: hypothetical protein JWO48_499 [Bryobacterales bacterium]|jgi:hypothetical protein|nr:hypothetical protein [Bryobacterales bacterium]
MAVINFAETRDNSFNNNAHYVSWTPLANGDSGTPYGMPGFADRTVQIAGTFGVGGTVVIEGTVDGTNYATLSDPQGNAISKTAAGIEAVSELVKLIRPRVTAGDGTTSITVALIARKA